MKEKKHLLDKVVKKGFKLEYPYFWYLENLSIEDLKKILKK